MKITFNIEADSAEEFAQALSVIRGKLPAVNSLEYLSAQDKITNNLAAVDDDTTQQEIDTPEVIVKVENGIEQVITMQPNTAVVEQEKKTRRTKAQIEADKLAALAATIAPKATPLITEEQLIKGDEILSAAEIRAAAGLPPLNATVAVDMPITLDNLRELCYPINKAVPGSIKKLLEGNGHVHIDKIPEDEYPAFKKAMEDFARANNIELKTV